MNTPSKIGIAGSTWFDLGLALALTALIQVQMWTAVPQNLLGPYGSGALFALFQSVPLIWRRRSPLVVLVVVLTFASLPPVIGGLGDNGFSFFGPLIALYTVAAYRTLRISAGAYAVSALVSTLLHQLPQMREFDPVYLAFTWIPLGGAWFLGVQVRLRRKYAAALEDRGAALETGVDLEARRAADEERKRVARELHDSVGHQLSIIAVQSGAARMYFDSDPEQARAVLGSVEKVAQQTQTEMKRLLVAIGDDSGQGSEHLAGVKDVKALIQQVQDAGYDVTFLEQGDVHLLPPALDLSAYRILQEALTNYVKHGGSRNANVVIDYRGNRLDLEVTNETRPVKPKKEFEKAVGHGLIGMQERVSLFGGKLETGSESGRFVVRASIPVEASV